MFLKKRNLVLLLSGIGVLLIAVAIFWWLFFSPVVSGTHEDTFVLKIKHGTSFNTIVNMMLENKIVHNKKKLTVVAKILGYKGKIKAGKYHVAGGTSSYRLLRQLVDGKVTIEWVTIPEGKYARQIASILKQKVEIDSSRFMQFVNDPDFTQKFDIHAATLEGFLFPDTYGFYWGMKSEEIISIMVKQFKAQFNDTLRARTKELGFSVLELITLASIVEGEAVIDSEREIIAAVYHNRLKKRMPLQADPTIQYIIKNGPRRLLKQDLAIDSPYNTYKYSGLPPGPINNPGLASIKASLYPANVNYLYFVANGDGSHTFSKTFNEHLRAKARFERYRKKINQLQRTEQKDG